MDVEARTVQPIARLGARVPPGPLTRLLRDRAGLGGLALILVVAIAAFLGPWLAPDDPNIVDPASKLLGPGPRHPLGTDQLGRDELSRLLYGARLSLSAATLAAGAMLLIGVAAGVTAGYYGGLLDHSLMRLVDILLAFPGLVLALAIAGTLGPSFGNLLLSVVVAGWAGYARLVRGVALSVRRQPYIEAAHAMGASRRRVIVRHLLPNLVGPVVVLWTLDLGRLLLTLAGLSFLGLGIQPPTAEWGSMLNQGRPYLDRAPQMMLYPGLAITLTVLAFNLFGDGLRDALDPRLRSVMR
ncbi:MAG: nickel transporter permease [Dehalococcoidia bacterium]